MFYIRFKKKIYWKNERIAHFHSFPLFWWAMWVNHSFRSNQMSDVSKLLISLTKNERPWAIRSGRSEEMSDVSESLISLTKKWANERSLEKFLLKKSKILLCYVLLKVKKKFRKNEWNAHFRSSPRFWWAMWVNRSFRSPKMSEWVNHSFFWVNRSFAHFWTKNERYAWKSNEWIPSPVFIH